VRSPPDDSTLAPATAPTYPEPIEEPHEIELVFAPQEDGGYHVDAPDLPGLHTQGDTPARRRPTPRKLWSSMSKDCAKTVVHSTPA
jgi:hypothetical protein